MANAQMGICANTSCFAYSSGRCFALSNVKCKYACPFIKHKNKFLLKEKNQKPDYYQSANMISTRKSMEVL